MKKPLLFIFSLVLVALAGGLAWQWLVPAVPHHRPALQLLTLDGKPLDLSRLDGKPVLVNFWASTCTGCMEEMPQLVRLYRDLAPRGLQVIGIAMSYDPPNRVLAVSRQRRVPYPIALDIHATAARAFGNVEYTPTTFLFAPDGRLVYHKTGVPDMAQLRQDIMGLLGHTNGSTRCDKPRPGMTECSG